MYNDVYSTSKHLIFYKAVDSRNMCKEFSLSETCNCLNAMDGRWDMKSRSNEVKTHELKVIWAVLIIYIANTVCYFSSSIFELPLIKNELVQSSSVGKTK